MQKEKIYVDILEAIEQFEEFKNNCEISRDKAIDIYNFFKVHPLEDKCEILHKGTVCTIERDDFWSYLNTSIIKELYSLKYRKTGALESVKNVEAIKLIELDSSFDAKLKELNIKEEISNEVDNEAENTLTEYTKLRKDAVTYKHKLNYERNSFNKKLREISELEELNKELIECLKNLKPVTIKSVEVDDTKNPENVGVVVLSDLHFNEIIDTASNNYDFTVASKRLKKLADTTKKTIDTKRLVILGLGDFINSDRRTSEIHNMCTNRNKAVIIGFCLLRQFIIDLADKYEITIAMVSGNESRVKGEEFDTSEDIATYNYDYTLYNMLKIAFENWVNISFIDGSFGEKVININGSNVLITHGVNLKSTNLQQSVSQTFGRYANMCINLDYLFAGHYHNCNIGDIYSLSGSLCGSNSYSEGTLNYTGRASQLIGVFYPDRTNSIVKVDLQNTYEIEGYDIKKLLQDMNVKSSGNNKAPIIHIA